MTRRLTAAVLACICMISFVLIMIPVQASAEETQQFTGEAVLLKQENSAYTFQITVSNNGNDFDGTVRFQIADSNGNACSAYDMELALPQGSEKQYMLTVPQDDISDSKGVAYITFLDEKDASLQQIKLTGILGDKAARVSVGVLSDQFDQLAYLQMPGQTYCVWTMESDINLVELSVSDLKKSLSSLYFLVIDDYDLSSLDSKQIQAIEDWVDQGGWLIIGTGSKGQEMISAFSKGFLNLTYVSTTEAGTPNEASRIVDRNQGNYAVYMNNGVDLQNMAYSEFTYNGNGGFFSTENPGWCIPIGQGSVMVLGISLTSPQLQSNGENVCYSLYDEVQYNSMKANTYTDSDNWTYLGAGAMNVLDRENTDVNFTSLRILIIIYVILVGPILYLILRKAKRSEWYWAAIPLFGVVFVGLVYLCGHGLQVQGIKTYSVSVQQADGQENPDLDTYLMGYRSGAKEWSMKLADNYQSAGGGFSMHGGAWQKAPKYTNHIVYSGNEIRVGADPSDDFDNEYFKAIGSGISIGSIDTQNLMLSANAQSGTVTNNTSQSFPYLGVQSNDYVLIIKDVAAGETVDIAESIKNKRAIYNQQIEYLDDAYDSLMNYSGYGNPVADVEDKDTVAALLIGMSDARQRVVQEKASIVVTAVDPDCKQYATVGTNERAYSCFYVVAEQEGTDASN